MYQILWINGLGVIMLWVYARSEYHVALSDFERCATKGAAQLISPAGRVVAQAD